ncbi:hypothetical protein [Phenylobacterium sp.]|uniref:hypothetical protein n=1 Tax=Phenylobacterium sp. TaxID=1871053 RepID=UPI001986F40E|nr:hypothetical protein [Phenylobacterium sp.]MBC7167854.1 hypothetical protein [Phenylobacterium sp.]
MTPACKPARGLAEGVAVRGVRTLLPETEAVIAAMAVPPSAARAALMDNLVAALKTCGAWGRFDGLFLTAAHEAQAARVNWAAPEEPGLNPVNSPVFHADSGYEGDGATSYLETGRRQGQGLYLPEDHHAGLWATSATGSGTAWGNGRNRIIPFTSGSVLATRSNAGATVSTPVSAGVGHSAFSRAAADRYRVFKDGVLLNEAEASTLTAVNQEFILLGYGTTTSVTGLSSWRVGALHFGAALEDSAMSAVAAALGRYLEGLSTWA